MVTKKATSKDTAARAEKSEAGANKLKAETVPRRQENAAAGKAKVARPAAETPSAKKEASEKGKKVKLVRDSFTMPESEYALVAQVKKRCIAKGVPAKKSEVLRAAIASFAQLSDAAIGQALAGLAPIKTGRPPNESK